MPRRFVSFVVFCVIALGLIFEGFLFVQRQEFQLFYITSGSMEPLMSEGTRVIVKRDAKIKPNDIVAFNNPETGRVTTHIFGGYTPKGTIRTKGMAVRHEDRFTPAPTQADVIGKVVYITDIRRKEYWTSSRGRGIMFMFASSFLLMGLYWGMRGGGQKARHAASSLKDTASQPV